MYSKTVANPRKFSKIFDFRSDTVTIPTEEMRKVMSEALVGDDVKNEDPTVHLLQEKIAKLCRKESALFVPSGTMSNQLALRTHVTNLYSREVIQHSIICDSRSHIYKYEFGGVSFHSGTQIKAIEIPHGSFLTASIIEKNLHFENDLHTPVTSIISLENTINGSVFPLEEIKKIHSLSKKYNILMHLDGARLWNASIATGIPFHEYSKYFDSISLCLSKGLGAPVGSVLVGSHSFIEKARQYRKLFGGGWRQAGILAAAGIYAIDNIWPLMKQDHLNTQRLYQGVIRLGFESTLPETNIIFVNSTKLGLKWEEIIAKLDAVNLGNKNEDKRVLIEGSGFQARFVLHHQISAEGVDFLLSLLDQVVSKSSKKSKL